MAFLVPLAAGVASGIIRTYENFQPIRSDAERYLKGEIDFKKATDYIVENVHIYIPLTTTKIVCDVIVFSISGQWIFNTLVNMRSIFKDLFKCGFEAFLNGIKSFFKSVSMSLRTCSIPLISTQFAKLFEDKKQCVGSISMWNFCNICNQIYFLILALTTDWKRTIQLDLVKYWLECMGIIRAIAESHNIDFLKYMNRYCSRRIDADVNSDQSSEVLNIQWERAKDPDFFQTINLTLAEIFHGGKYNVKVNRNIREIDQQEVKTEKGIYTVTIEPGCPDGEEFRFLEAGHRDPVSIPGDLVVKVQTSSHQLYERNGSDLIYRVNIPLEDARYGELFQVPLIDGGTMECDLYKSMDSNKEIIIDHAGLPNPKNQGIRGRLIVQCDIKLPDTKMGAEPTEPSVSNPSSE